MQCVVEQYRQRWCALAPRRKKVTHANAIDDDGMMGSFTSLIHHQLTTNGRTQLLTDARTCVQDWLRRSVQYNNNNNYYYYLNMIKRKRWRKGNKRLN